MRTLSPEEMAALAAFRDLFPKERCKTLKLVSWKGALFEAWAKDWPEQRGLLRSLRNDPCFDTYQDIIIQFERQS